VQNPIIDSIIADNGQVFAGYFLSASIFQVFLSNGNATQFSPVNDGGWEHSSLVYDSTSNEVYLYGAPYGIYPAIEKGLWKINTLTGQYKLAWKAEGYTLDSMILLQDSQQKSPITEVEKKTNEPKPTLAKLSGQFLNTGLNFTYVVQGPKFWSSDDLYIGSAVPGTAMVVLQYYFNQTYYLTAVSAEGEEMWQYTHTYPQEASNFLSPVFSTDNSTVISNVFNSLVAFDSQNGNVLWTETYDTNTIWKSSWTDVSSVVVWTLNSINALDLTTGQQLWSVQSDNYTRWITISPDTKFLYGARFNTVFKMSTANGKTLWTSDPSLFLCDGQLAAVSNK
jgi:outer membrane protein assembly factor BamB